MTLPMRLVGALLVAGCAAQPGLPTVPPSYIGAAQRVPPRVVAQHPSPAAVSDDEAFKEELRQKLDQILTADSSGWLFNHYDAESANNVFVAKRYPNEMMLLIAGSYTINHGKPMRVAVALKRTGVACIATSDFPDVCRPLGQPPSHDMARAALRAGSSATQRPYSAPSADPDSQQPINILEALQNERQEEQHREQENRDAVSSSGSEMNNSDLPYPGSAIAPDD